MTRKSLIIPALLLFLSAPAHAAAPQGFEDLSEKLLPTVVNISTTTRAKAAEPAPGAPELPEFPEGSPFDKFFNDFYEQFRNAPQAEGKTSSLGSGFVIDAANGYIVTNNHVIKDADEIRIILHDNTSLDATRVGTDEKTDIAVLKVKPVPGMAAAAWGDSDAARVGSWVIAIGNPFGLGGTVTAGIVSARQRNINAGPYDDFIQTDASINRGNSGGPMFNTAGEVIGVNTAIFSPSGGSVGIGFAVPSALARPVVEQLIRYGHTKRGWIGVRIQDVTPEIAESLKLDKPRGALVAGITPGGPSEEAGMKAGDVITKFDGKDVESMRFLPRIVAETEINRTVPVSVWRKGKEVTLQIRLGQLEKAEENGLLSGAGKDGEGAAPAPADQTQVDDIGLSLSAISDILRKSHEIPASVSGAVVTAVDKNGPAAEKGVTPGDVIIEVDQQETATPKDVITKITAARKEGRGSVLLFIARRDDMRFVALKLKK